MGNRAHAKRPGLIFKDEFHIPCVGLVRGSTSRQSDQPPQKHGHWFDA